MIQDIFPKRLNNEYIHKPISKNSVIFAFKDDKVLCNNNSEVRFPLYENIECANHEYIYLFEVDSVDFFLAKQENLKASSEFDYKSINIFRTMSPKHLSFAVITAYHLYHWYNYNKFCGKCGSDLRHDIKERVLLCEKCKNLIYPKISPVVIVGVVNGNKLLMTKYANKEYKSYALIAGFIEIGETAEEAVKREVMEEVGLNIKDIKYYKSQPWGLTESLLLGYFAQLDGESNLLIDKNELSEAIWIERDEIPMEIDNLSLTNQMIYKFINYM